MLVAVPESVACIFTYLRIQVQRNSKMPNRQALLPQTLIQSTQQEMHHRLIRRQILQDHQLLQRSLHITHRHQRPRLLKPHQCISRRQIRGSAEIGECLTRILLLFEDSAHAADEDGVGGGDGGGRVEVRECFLKLALFFVDTANSVVGVLVALVCCDGFAVRSHSLIILLVRNVLVTLQGECVGKFGVKLSGTVEAS